MLRDLTTASEVELRAMLKDAGAAVLTSPSAAQGKGKKRERLELVVEPREPTAAALKCVAVALIPLIAQALAALDAAGRSRRTNRVRVTVASLDRLEPARR